MSHQFRPAGPAENESSPSAGSSPSAESSPRAMRRFDANKIYRPPGGGFHKDYPDYNYVRPAETTVGCDADCYLCDEEGNVPEGSGTYPIRQRHLGQPVRYLTAPTREDFLAPDIGEKFQIDYEKETDHLKEPTRELRLPSAEEVVARGAVSSRPSGGEKEAESLQFPQSRMWADWLMLRREAFEAFNEFLREHLEPRAQELAAATSGGGGAPAGRKERKGRREEKKAKGAATARLEAIYDPASGALVAGTGKRFGEEGYTDAMRPGLKDPNDQPIRLQGRVSCSAGALANIEILATRAKEPIRELRASPVEGKISREAKEVAGLSARGGEAPGEKKTEGRGSPPTRAAQAAWGAGPSSSPGAEAEPEATGSPEEEPSLEV